MKLQVYLGFDSLGSWLSLPGLRALPAGCEVRIEPLLASVGDVTTRAGGKEDPLAALKARRAKARRAFHEAEHLRKCQRLGISAEAGMRPLDPLPPVIGLKWLADQSLAADKGAAAAQAVDYAEAVFAAHYREGREVAGAEAIETLLHGAGAQTDGFAEAYEGLGRALEAGRDAMLEKGILGSPTFILEGEVFLGREHYPLINWMLNGRKGAPPV